MMESVMNYQSGSLLRTRALEPVGVRGQLLLERLRSKSSNYKSFPDLAKSVRTAMLDTRRFSLDVVEKGILQKSLDLLQEKISVRSAAGMAERLETIGRKIGLKFMAAPVHGCYYLSTDMFYVEINIDSQNGNVNEAKIHHIDATKPNQPPNTENCPEIIECLSRGQFSKFVQHLQGLVSVYDLSTATLAEKSRSWMALRALEVDIENIFNSYARNNNANVVSLMHESPLGLVIPRQGGLSMTIRYFVSPHDLYDQLSNKMLEPTFENLTNYDLCQSVTVMLEKSAQNCILPMMPLMNGFAKQYDLNASNSYSLPARFVLKLKNPIPLSLEKCQDIESLTTFKFFNAEEALPMMHLIVKNKSNGLLQTVNNRGLFVTLPGQQHCYILTDSRCFKAVMVDSIPFSQPSQVHHIISILRQQTLFNTLVETCVRINSIQDLERSIMFEVLSTDLSILNLTFEHPSKECVMSVELDLKTLSDLKCKIYDSSGMEKICSDSVATKYFKMCMSIPVLMRMLVMKGQTLIKPPEFPKKMETSSETQNADVNGFNGVKNGNESPFLSQKKQNGKENLASNTLITNIKMETESVSVKEEPMDFQTSSQVDSLNMYGPQDVTCDPEASFNTFSFVSSHQSSGNMPISTSAHKTEKHANSVLNPSISIKAEKTGSMAMLPKVENVKPEFQLTKSTQPPNKTVVPEIVKKESVKKEIHHKLADIKPSFSITPVTTADSNLTTSQPSSKKAGIEIIPLGGEKSSHSSSSKGQRDIRRSLSEDDKKRLEKKKLSSMTGSSFKKRKHESGLHPSGSSSSLKKKFEESSFRNKSSKSSSSKNIESVIDRLAKHSAETGIEVRPVSSSGNVSGEKGKANSPSLKLTLKTPGKVSGNSMNSKDFSSKSKSSSGSSTSSKSSMSSSFSKHKFSSHMSSGSHHSKHSPALSSTSQHSKDHKYKSSSSKRHSSESKSSIKDIQQQRERDEEVKKLLAGNKLNKTFQIPKITKGSSPSTHKSDSRHTPTTSPKYSISPKQQNQSLLPSTSPKYIGGGTVTPPNISPKHSYSAPSSVVGQSRSSPMNASPKAGNSKTPSASPTYHQASNFASKYPMTGHGMMHPSQQQQQFQRQPSGGNPTEAEDASLDEALSFSK